MTAWNEWLSAAPQRMEQLDYDASIHEARKHLEDARSSRGTARRYYEIRFNGHLGTLLSHSGRVSESVPCFQDALAGCIADGDAEGQTAYLNNLLEAHRYLDDGLAIGIAEQLLKHQAAQGLATAPLQKRIERLRRGEPLCRVNCVRNGEEQELDEITTLGQGGYQFQFQRNRMSLMLATALTQQGNRLTVSGQQADALEKYHAASEVDPFDPDPVYQCTACLLELGAYAQAREAAETTERLAPGWFHCRTDRWLATALEAGAITDDELRLLRILEDGGLKPPQATRLADEALQRFPGFAPFHLIRGDLHRNADNEQLAIRSYRRGLEHVEEPDLESRLLCALAAALPKEAPERPELLRRVLALEGNLVAQATARLLALQ
jgi:tetratricopeptide (TPR) repeat protein